MNTKILNKLAPFAAIVGALCMTGCGAGLPAAPGATLITGLKGVAHGGQSPIQGASIKLYVASSTASAYGSGATVIGTATTDAGGNFTIGTPATPATCPSGSQAYITVAGGYPSGSPTLVNKSLLEMLALGDCVNVSASTSIVVSEVTTVAAGYALSGFMTTSADATDSTLFQAIVGAPAANSASAGSTTAAMGLVHAFTNAAAIATGVSGMANSYGPTFSSANKTYAGTIPQAEVNTLADIMQSCVNSATGSTACTSLFSFTPSVQGVKPTNTLQAMINLARNPYPSAAAMTSSTGLFSLVSSSPAFLPTLSVQPPDWALTIVYAAYNGNTLPNPYYLAMDANDSVYYTNSFTNPRITGVSAYGATFPVYTNATGVTSSNLRTMAAADSLGNIWVVSGPGTQSSVSGSFLLQWSAGGGGAPTQTFFSGRSLYSVAVDRSNNLWLGDITTATPSVVELAYTAGTPATYATNYTAATPGAPYYMGVDANQNIWPVNFTSSTTTSKSTVLPNLSVGTTNAAKYTVDPTTSTVITAVSEPFASSAIRTSSIAFDSAGNAWYDVMGSYSTSTAGTEESIPTVNTSGVITDVTPQTLVANATLGDTSLSGGLSPAAIDGAATYFIPDYFAGNGIHVYSTVAGTKSSNTSTQVISQPSGLIGCFVNLTTLACYTSGTTVGAEPAVAQPRAVLVDSAGSLWGGNNAGGAFQIIGLAAPSWPLLQLGKWALSPGLTTTQALP